KVLRNDQIDFDVVKGWIAACTTERGSKCNGHENGRSRARRLIDVEKSCIVDGSTVKEYLSLSYVWGMAAQFMLTKDVVEDSTNEDFFRSLGTKIPQSIRDAMQVCRNIGVRHLWVDALCIVQDDDEDKKDQIGLMDEIYGHALAVLIVVAGDDAGYGIPGMGEKKRALASYQETVDGKVLMTSLSTTTFSAKRSQWNTRAWT
ncbi:HET-domain-containing protein, partial [Trematosphaeria pertusa]